MLLSFSIRHTHAPVYAVAGAKIHHNTFVYNSRICGGEQVGTEVPAPPLRTSCSRMCALLYTHCALIPNCSALLSRFARYSRIAPHFVLLQFCAAFTLRPVGLRVHVASSRQMRYMPRASSRMCALDGILTRKSTPPATCADRMPPSNLYTILKDLTNLKVLLLE